MCLHERDRLFHQAFQRGRGGDRVEREQLVQAIGEVQGREFQRGDELAQALELEPRALEAVQPR